MASRMAASYDATKMFRRALTSESQPIPPRMMTVPSLCGTTLSTSMLAAPWKGRTWPPKTPTSQIEASTTLPAWQFTRIRFSYPWCCRKSNLNVVQAALVAPSLRFSGSSTGRFVKSSGAEGAELVSGVVLVMGYLGRVGLVGLPFGALTVPCPGSRAAGVRHPVAPGKCPARAGTAPGSLDLTTGQNPGVTCGDDHGRTRVHPTAAFGLFELIVAAVIVAAVSATLVGLNFADARDSFVVANSVFALSCALAGVLLAWQRPRNPVGWLLLVAGYAHGLSAGFGLVALAGPARGWPPGLVRAAATIASFAWPCSIALFLPLALLLFPDGRLPSPRWRPVVALLVVAAALYTAERVTDPTGFVGDGRGMAAVVLPNHAELSWLWIVTEVGIGLLYFAALLGLVLRFRRSDERIRGLAVWVVVAVIAIAATMAIWLPINRDAPLLLVLLVIPLLPAAITIAILRHQQALARIGERLSSDAGDGEAEVLDAVRDALRLSYVALRIDGKDRATVGVPPAVLEAVPLDYRGERVGELVVGVPSGRSRLDVQDRAAVELLAAPLAVAVHANALSRAVQRSREQIVAAREEERRRLRRDLHDGLGPALTGIAFRADAAVNLLRSDPDRAAAQLAELRDSATAAINDVRRLVYALRPPTLDELGLAGALRRHAEQLTGGPRVSIEVEEPLPALPAAVEVAAYRIGVEALTNAVRHARASHVELSVLVDGALKVSVRDDGPGGLDAWDVGVGLSSIRERTAELGGHCGAGPMPAGGGLVWARLPLTPTTEGSAHD